MRTGRLKLTFRVEEGRRLAVSGIRVDGNTSVSDDDDRQRDGDEARGILLVAEGRVRRRQVSPAISAERFPQLYATAGSSTSRSSRTR